MVLVVNFVLGLLISSAILIAFLYKPAASDAVEKRIGSISGTATRNTHNFDLVSILKKEKSSSFDWIEKHISESEISRWINRLLLQADSRQSVGSVLTAMTVLGLLAFFITYHVTGLWLLALSICIPMGYGPIGFLIIQRSRRLRSFEAVLPSAIEMCARSLRAGHSITVSIGILAEQAAEPARFEFHEVFKAQSHGLPLRDALYNMLQRIPSKDLQIMVTGILVQKDTGGNLAEIMDRISSVIRDRLRIQGDIRTQTAQGRLTGWILCLLPVALLVFINLVNPGYSNMLLKDPAGREMLYAALVLLFVGILMIRSIVRRSDI